MGWEMQSDAARRWRQMSPEGAVSPLFAGSCDVRRLTDMASEKENGKELRKVSESTHLSPPARTLQAAPASKRNIPALAELCRRRAAAQAGGGSRRHSGAGGRHPAAPGGGASGRHPAARFSGGRAQHHTAAKVWFLTMHCSCTACLVRAAAAGVPGFASAVAHPPAPPSRRPAPRASVSAPRMGFKPATHSTRTLVPLADVTAPTRVLAPPSAASKAAPACGATPEPAPRWAGEGGAPPEVGLITVGHAMRHSTTLHF